MSIEKELEFNVLNRISLLYNQKTDNTGILNVDDMFGGLTPEQKRHMCAGYCYNNMDYEFCALCPDKSKNKKTPELVSSNKEPGYYKQFTKLTSDDTTDKIIYNNNDLVPYENTTLQPTKTFTQNGKTYKIYAPYIVLKGE